MSLRIVRAEGSGAVFDNLSKLDDCRHSILSSDSQLLLRGGSSSHQSLCVLDQGLCRLQNLFTVIGKGLALAFSVQSASGGKHDGGVQVTDDAGHCGGGVDARLGSSGTGLECSQNL